MQRNFGCSLLAVTREVVWEGGGETQTSGGDGGDGSNVGGVNGLIGSGDGTYGRVISL